MNHAKTAEPIVIQFDMCVQMGPRNHVHCVPKKHPEQALLDFNNFWQKQKYFIDNSQSEDGI